MRGGCGGRDGRLFVNGVLKTTSPGRPRLGPWRVVDSAVSSQPERSSRTRVVRSCGAAGFLVLGCQGRDERSRTKPCSSTARWTTSRYSSKRRLTTLETGSGSAITREWTEGSHSHV